MLRSAFSTMMALPTRRVEFSIAVEVKGSDVVVDFTPRLHVSGRDRSTALYLRPCRRRGSASWVSSEARTYRTRVIFGRSRSVSLRDRCSVQRHRRRSSCMAGPAIRQPRRFTERSHFPLRFRQVAAVICADWSSGALIQMVRCGRLRSPTRPAKVPHMPTMEAALDHRLVFGNPDDSR